LLNYLTRREKPTNSNFLLARNEVEENKAVAKVLEWKMVQQVLQSIFPQNGMSA